MNLKTLLLSSFLFTLILTNVGVALLSMIPPVEKGAQDAYITKIEYPEATFSGKNVTLLLMVYNKNCVSEGKNGSFFFNFYINDKFWWSEFNNTSYKIWKCPVEASVLRIYSIPGWSTIKPIYNNVRIELEWFNGSETHLQDTISFPLRIVVRVSFANTLILSYLAIYVITLFLIGFYMVVSGRLRVLTLKVKNDFFSLNNETPPNDPIYKNFPIFFYIFILISWQALNSAFNALRLPGNFGQHIGSLIQTFYLTLLIIIVRKKNLHPDGWKNLWPPKISKHFSVYIALALIYTVIVIFIPGIFTEIYHVYPFESIDQISSLILLAFVGSVTTETIFRGFIQSIFKKEKGFIFALLVTSLMYSLYSTFLLSFELRSLFCRIVYFFTLGIFLGILFDRTKTLLSTIIFSFTVLILTGITPIKTQIAQFESLFFHLFALGLSLAFLYFLTVNEVEDAEEWLMSYVKINYRF